ncbi:MAG: hypothetical protein V2I39_12035 [Erythrobacter sp.]|jgi:hypothetical protein|nr:hypothetical protein [Erythrobacter sp.]
MTALLGLLVAGTLPLDLRSGLVEEGHAHEWVEFFNEPSNLAFVDAGYADSARIGERDYPVALVRYLRGTPAFEVVVTDFRIAIDCEGSAMAGITVWSVGKDGETGDVSDVPPDFEAVSPANEARVAGIFRQVCGPDWSIDEDG